MKNISMRRFLALVLGLTLLMAMAIPCSAQAAAKVTTVKGPVRYKIETLNTNYLLPKTYTVKVYNKGSEPFKINVSNAQGCTVSVSPKTVYGGSYATITIKTPRGTCAHCCYTLENLWTKNGNVKFNVDAPNVQWVMRDY